MPAPLRALLLLAALSAAAAAAAAGGVSQWPHSHPSSMCRNPPAGQDDQLRQPERVFVRNCSAADMQPPFLPTPADIAALAHVLHNRTVAFIGDSTMQSQYEYLCLKLKGRNSRKKWRYPKNYFMEPSFCPLPHLGARTALTFQGAGQRFDWARLPPLAVSLNNTMHSLRPMDVVIFNAGLHWHAGCKKGTDTGKKYAELLGSVRDMLSRSQHCREEWSKVSVSHLAGDAASTLPLVQCGYPLNQRFVGDVEGLVPGQPLRCVELTPARAAGGGLREHNACNPNCLPSTWQNDLANPIMLEQCVDIMYAYEDFRCLHKYHSGEDNWDCSHYTVELVHYLNWKLLQMVGRVSRRRRSVRSRRFKHQAAGIDAAW